MKHLILCLILLASFSSASAYRLTILEDDFNLTGDEVKSKNMDIGITITNATITFRVYDDLESDIIWDVIIRSGEFNTTFAGVNTELSKGRYVYGNMGLGNWQTTIQRNIFISDILRTKGWHQFKFIVNESGTDAYIDNILLSEKLGSKDFRYLEVYKNSNPSAILNVDYILIDARYSAPAGNKTTELLGGYCNVRINEILFTLFKVLLAVLVATVVGVYYVTRRRG